MSKCIKDMYWTYLIWGHCAFIGEFTIYMWVFSDGHPCGQIDRWDWYLRGIHGRWQTTLVLVCRLHIFLKILHPKDSLSQNTPAIIKWKPTEDHSAAFLHPKALSCTLNHGLIRNGDGPNKALYCVKTSLKQSLMRAESGAAKNQCQNLTGGHTK